LPADLPPCGHVGAGHLDAAFPAPDPTAGLGRAGAVGGDLDRLGCADVGHEGRVAELGGEGGEDCVGPLDQFAVAYDEDHVIDDVRTQARGVVGRDQAVGELALRADGVFGTRHGFRYEVEGGLSARPSQLDRRR
jgi:hypothetical protein